ncbi:hypothetical protein, partial [Arthrobacter sp. 35/47]|uniref:hypothetical protein n=1 Tax=Arthrobacter sp. 35/47 TaxID=269454 RepID=UPI001C1DE74F
MTAWEPWAGIAQAIVFGLTVLLAVPIPARPRFVHVPQSRSRAAVGSGSNGRRAPVPGSAEASTGVGS